MTQKVVVDVTPAEPSWPRTFDSYSDAEDAGAVFEVLVNGQALEMYHFENNTPISKKDSPGFADSTSWIGFPDFESAARWWLDPKPVVDSPAPVPLGDCPSRYFSYEGTLLVVGRKKVQPGMTPTWDCVSLEDHAIYEISESILVTPFYGKITLDVKPG